LVTIYVTHRTHHLFGLAVLHQAFPSARIVALPATVSAAKTGSGPGMLFTPYVGNQNFCGRPARLGGADRRRQGDDRRTETPDEAPRGQTDGRVRVGDVLVTKFFLDSRISAANDGPRSD